MLDIKDQVDGQINSFEKFFADYNDNQNVVIIPHYNTHLLSGNRTGSSFDILHTPSKDNLFGDLSDSDLLEFIHQEGCVLFNTKSI